MSGTKKILAVLAAFTFAGAILFVGGCDVGQVLASGYSPLGYFNPGYFPFTATPFSSGFNSAFNPSTNTPFNTVPGVTPGTGTIPNVGSGNGTTINNDLFNNMNMGAGTTTNTIPSSPPIPTLENGMNTMFGGSSTVGQTTGSFPMGF